MAVGHKSRKEKRKKSFKQQKKKKGSERIHVACLKKVHLRRSVQC